MAPTAFSTYVKENYQTTAVAVKRASPGKPSCVYVGMTMRRLGEKYRQSKGLPAKKRKSSPKRRVSSPKRTGTSMVRRSSRLAAKRR